MASQDWFDKDFYAVLGVSKDVSDAELKKTYRKLARQYHPDSNPGDAKAEARFKEISEAYSVLSDPEQRAEYDQVRAMGSGARFTAGGAGQRRLRGRLRRHVRRRRPAAARSYSAGGFEDLLGGMFGGGGFGTSSGGFRGYGGPTQGRRRHGEHDARLPHRDPRRHGHARSCRAAARPRSRSRPASPTARRSGSRARASRAPTAAQPGDLVLTVAVRKHPVFERDGLNLRVDVPVTFVEAALGATIEVPTLDGEPGASCEVAAGTPSGRVLRVKGRGVTTAKGTGDLLATVVRSRCPRHLPGDAKEALEAFAAGDARREPARRAARSWRGS